jgi:hypothetical protein
MARTDSRTPRHPELNSIKETDDALPEYVQGTPHQPFYPPSVHVVRQRLFDRDNSIRGDYDAHKPVEMTTVTVTSFSRDEAP